ncbi:histamine H2 receptor-like [Exaiptasia diaphana]|uniref:G-protein coupled receptors family 1 profile domain-containing protein n=1 Tax=Exaiptasia diaphana TaxID=2652724 RepID=A0A913XYG8_EXADI|nr:histamine H2 receptor-like [Exaiptasia diaphana]
MANSSSSMSSVSVSSSPAYCFLSVLATDPYNTTNIPDSVNPTRTVLSVFNGVASPLTVVINALIAWSILGDEDLRSSSFNILLVALAVTDFLVGLLVQPIFSYHQSCLVNNCYSPCPYTVYILSLLTFCGLSVGTLTFVSLERYLAIEHPNFYRKMVTVKRFVLGTMTYWAVSLTILMSATVFAIYNKSKLLLAPPMAFLGLSTLVILYCSIKVQVTAYRQRRTIVLQQESVQQPDEQQRQQERLKEYKRVFMATILVIVSILFYVPFIIVVAIQAVAGKDVTSDFKYVAMAICLTLLHLQSLVNPILVSLRLSYIRTSIKNKLVSCFSCN